MIRQDASPAPLDSPLCVWIAERSIGTICLSEVVIETESRVFFVEDMPSVSLPALGAGLGRLLFE